VVMFLLHSRYVCWEFKILSSQISFVYIKRMIVSGKPLIKVLHLPLNEVSFLCSQHVLGFRVAHVQLF
jgi:hypothetical protein